MFYLIIFVSIVFGSLRIYGIVNKSFQAFAHIFVGLLIGLYIETHNNFYLYTVSALSVLELICAIYFRVIKKKL